MDQTPNEPILETKPPIGLAWYASTLSLGVVDIVVNCLAAHVSKSWIKLFLYPPYILIPMAITFTILYRSNWHRDRPSLTRICLLTFISGLIYCATWVGIVLMLILATLITLGFKVDLSPQ